MKICSSCLTEKSLEEFCSDKRCKDGKASECRSCHTIRNREYYQKNKEKRQQYAREWHARNPGRRSEFQKKSANKRKNDDYRPFMLAAAKARAKTGNLDFSLTIDDIIIPDLCPFLGILLVPSIGKGPADNSPSLDRIRPEFGYVPNNVWVISQRANRIKNNSTLDELKLLVKALEQLFGV